METPDGRDVGEESEHDEQWAIALAKIYCVIAGFDPVDAMDGSQNWWMYYNEAVEKVSDIRQRHPR